MLRRLRWLLLSKALAEEGRFVNEKRRSPPMMVMMFFIFLVDTIRFGPLGLGLCGFDSLVGYAGTGVDCGAVR